MENISEKFDHLYQVTSSERFLKKESLGGEIPFFISAYHPEQELEVQKAIAGLIKKLEAAGLPVLELNLYDIACEILEAKGGIQRMFQVERKRPKDKFLRALQSSLNIHEVLIPKVSELIAGSDAKVVFMTGIGLVFPFIRSHNILNNLQNVIKEAPLVTFFAGKYDGYTLRLFDRLKDDNYYRAFNIDKIEPIS